eukprot:scaffold21186_cov67-Phaeocystis_antarctica.AAC.1
MVDARAYVLRFPSRRATPAHRAPATTGRVDGFVLRVEGSVGEVAHAAGGLEGRHGPCKVGEEPLLAGEVGVVDGLEAALLDPAAQRHAVDAVECRRLVERHVAVCRGPQGGQRSQRWCEVGRYERWPSSSSGQAEHASFQCPPGAAWLSTMINVADWSCARSSSTKASEWSPAPTTR